MGRLPTVDEVPGIEARDAAARVGASPLPGILPVRIEDDHATLEAVPCRFGGVRW